MKARVNGLSSQFRHLEKEEHDLEKKEEKLDKKEKQIDNELTDLEFKKDEHHELPHPRHSFNPFHMHHSFSMPRENPLQAIFGGLGDFLREARRTGPAEDHHMGPIVPTHNLLHPGAHPSQKSKDEEKKEQKDTKNEKKDEKKEEPKKDESKKEDHKEPAKKDMKAKKIE